MLVIKDLHKSYDIGHNKLHVLKGINLEIGEGGVRFDYGKFWFWKVYFTEYHWYFR